MDSAFYVHMERHNQALKNLKRFYDNIIPRLTQKLSETRSNGLILSGNKGSIQFNTTMAMKSFLVLIKIKPRHWSTTLPKSVELKITVPPPSILTCNKTLKTI